MIKRSLQDIIDFIMIEDALKPVDLLIVPGTSQTKAIDRAKSLIQQGFADKLLISGGTNRKLGSQTEADYLANYALSIGISQEQLLLEREARDTFENACNSAKLCRSLSLDVQTAILICKNYHARRALQTFEEHFLENVVFFVSPYRDEKEVSKDSVIVNPEHQDLLYQELAKIGQYHLINQKRRTDESISDY